MIKRSARICAAITLTALWSLPAIAELPTHPIVILGLTFTYTRDASTLTARGLAQGHVMTDAMGLANNWLLVGSIEDGGIGCTAFGACSGQAMIFDLNRFAQ